MVKAVSGVQTVRFKNELERNITIKLGKSHCYIPVFDIGKKNVQSLIKDFTEGDKNDSWTQQKCKNFASLHIQENNLSVRLIFYQS